MLETSIYSWDSHCLVWLPEGKLNVLWDLGSTRISHMLHDVPCMVCLATFGWFWWQMLVNIPAPWSIWVLICQVQMFIASMALNISASSGQRWASMDGIIQAVTRHQPVDHLCKDLDARTLTKCIGRSGPRKWSWNKIASQTFMIFCMTMFLLYLSILCTYALWQSDLVMDAMEKHHFE